MSFESSAGRGRFEDIQMPVRVIKDRSPTAFSRDVASLRENAFGVVITTSGAEIALISKARNYSSTPFDTMVSFLDERKSAIHVLSDDDREDFFGLVTGVARGMRELSGLPIAIGLNQHPNGHLLPYRNEAGQKNRVQTLQPLHVHVYEIGNYADKKQRMGNLDKEEQTDISDPLLKLSGEILQAELSQSASLLNAGASFDLRTDALPLGLHVVFPIGVDQFLTEYSELLAQMQDQALHVYGQLANVFTQPTGPAMHLLSIDQRRENMDVFLDTTPYALPGNSETALRWLANNIKDVKDVPSHHTFVNGFAVTYTIMDKGNDTTLVNIHPRLMSRGNSPDSLGIYKENTSEETEADILGKIDFYNDLLENLHPTWHPLSGPFLIAKTVM